MKKKNDPDSIVTNQDTGEALIEGSDIFSDYEVKVFQVNSYNDIQDVKDEVFMGELVNEFKKALQEFYKRNNLIE